MVNTNTNLIDWTVYKDKTYLYVFKPVYRLSDIIRQLGIDEPNFYWADIEIIDRPRLIVKASNEDEVYLLIEDGFIVPKQELKRETERIQSANFEDLLDKTSNIMVNNELNINITNNSYIVLKDHSFYEWCYGEWQYHKQPRASDWIKEQLKGEQ